MPKQSDSITKNFHAAGGETVKPPAETFEKGLHVRFDSAFADGAPSKKIPS